MRIVIYMCAHNIYIYIYIHTLYVYNNSIHQLNKVLTAMITTTTTAGGCDEPGGHRRGSPPGLGRVLRAEVRGPEEVPARPRGRARRALEAADRPGRAAADGRHTNDNSSINNYDTSILSNNSNDHNISSNNNRP